MPNESLVYVDMKSFDKLKQYVSTMDDVVLMATDKALANLGAEGRKVLGKYEKDQGFKFGQTQTKWSNKSSSYVTKVSSYMDSSHGWFKASDGRRMIGFKFENASYSRRANKNNVLRARLQAISTGYVYSLMANLYYKDVRYSKTSPWFHREGEADFRWKRRMTRYKRIDMTAERLNPALEPARQKTDQDIEKILLMKGLK